MAFDPLAFIRDFSAPSMPSNPVDPDPLLDAGTGQTPDYEEILLRATTLYGVDPDLIRAQMGAESAYNPRATGPVRPGGQAKGYMQLMPDTARDLGVPKDKIYDPEYNIFAGVKLMRQNLDQFGNDPHKALAAYNAGPRWVQEAQEKAGPRWFEYMSTRDPRLPSNQRETRDYVLKITDKWKKLKGGEIPGQASSITGTAPSMIPRSFSPSRTSPVSGFDPERFIREFSTPEGRIDPVESSIDLPASPEQGMSQPQAPGGPQEPTMGYGTMMAQGYGLPSPTQVPEPLSGKGLEYHEKGKQYDEWMKEKPWALRTPEGYGEFLAKEKLADKPAPIPEAPEYPGPEEYVTDPMGASIRAARKGRQFLRETRESKGDRTMVGKTIGEIPGIFRKVSQHLTTGWQSDEPTYLAQMGKRVEEAEQEILAKAYNEDPKFMEEITMILGEFKNSPMKTLGMFGQRMLEDLPLLLMTGRITTGMVESLRVAGDAAKTGKQLSGIRKLATRLGYKDYLAEELAGEISAAGVQGYLTEQGRGSDYSGAEALMDLGFATLAPAIAGIRTVKNMKVGKIRGLENLEGMKKLTRQEWDRIETLSVTDNLEGMPHVQEIIPIIQELTNSKEYAEPLMRFNLSETKSFWSKERLKEAGYPADWKPGFYREGGTYKNGKIELFPEATPSSVMEEFVHFLQDRVRKHYPDIQKRLDVWTDAMKRADPNLPKGDELFGQAFVANTGYLKEYPTSIQNLKIPDVLMRDFKALIGDEKFNGHLLKKRTPEELKKAGARNEQEFEVKEFLREFKKYGQPEKPDKLPRKLKKQVKKEQIIQEAEAKKIAQEEARQKNVEQQKLKYRDQEPHKSILEKYPDGATKKQIQKYMWEQNETRLSREEAGRLIQETYGKRPKDLDVKQALKETPPPKQKLKSWQKGIEEGKTPQEATPPEAKHSILNVRPNEQTLASPASVPGPLYSLREVPRWQDEVRSWMEHNNFSEKEIKKQIKSGEDMINLMSAVGLRDAHIEVLPVGAGLNEKWGPIRKNVDGNYLFSLDLSAICVKRDVFQATVNKLVELNGGKSLDVDQLAAVGAKLRNLGEIAPCLQCYVDWPRYKASEQLKVHAEYLADPGVLQKTIDELDVDKRNVKIAEIKEKIKKYKVSIKKRKDAGRTDTKAYADDVGKLKRAEAKLLKPLDNRTETQIGSLKRRLEEIEDLRKEGAINPKAIDQRYFTDPEYQASVPKTHPALDPKNQKMYAWLDKQYRDAKANLPKLYEDYFGQILKIPEDTKLFLNSIAGLRVFSTSDFRPEHLIDAMQAFKDMELRAFLSHAYTKVPEYAEIFGKTGQKIQLSLMAKEVDGKIVEDLDGSMPWEEAKRLRKTSPDIGTILVGTSDKIIEWGLNNPDIDYIIPFHYSGMPEKYFKKVGWKDYSFVLDRIADDKVKKAVISGKIQLSDFQKRYVSVEKTQTGKTVKIHIPQSELINFKTGTPDAQIGKKYLAIIDKLNKDIPGKQTGLGILPQFDDFRKNVNYGKLVKYVSRTDTPFRPVKAVFNESKAKAVFNQAVNNPQKIGPNQKVIDELWPRIKKKESDLGVKVMDERKPKETKQLHALKPVEPLLKKSDLAEEYQKVITEPAHSPGNAWPTKFGRGLEKALTPISSRLERISSSLKYKVRDYVYGSLKNANKYRKDVEPLLKKFRAMNKDDKKVLDLALFNGNRDLVDDIIQKYGMLEEYKAVEKALADIWQEAEAAGYDAGWLENYWPRAIKDREGLVNNIQKSKEWSPIWEKIQERQKKIGDRPITTDEQIEVINNYLKGGTSGQPKVPDNVKARRIKELSAELSKYYHDSGDSLLKYIESMTLGIEARKFFGKSIVMDLDGKLDADNSIGGYTLKLREEGKIDAGQEMELKGMLNALFAPGKAGEITSLFRNLEYIDTMGSVSSALTQIQDITFAMHNAGVFNALATYVSPKKIKMEDVNIIKIAHEFTEPSRTGKAVEETFKWTGLTFMDRLGKETLINSSFKKMKKQAKNSDPALDRKLKKVFGEDAGQVKADLEAGKISENVKYLLWNEVADMQPIALSEMPEYYLRSGNLKILYMLKSFTIKQVDVFRNAAIRDIQEAKGIKEKTEAVGRLARLTGAFVALGMVADTAKNIVFGRDVDLTDEFIDNMWKVVGLSKYVAWQFRDPTVSTYEAGILQIAPPFKILRALGKDVWGLASGDKKVKDIETASSIPFGGKLYYWWFGGGKEKNLRRREYQKKAKWDDMKKWKKLRDKMLELPDEEMDAFEKKHPEIGKLHEAKKLKYLYNAENKRIKNTDDPKEIAESEKEKDALIEEFRKLAKE